MRFARPEQFGFCFLMPSAPSSTPRFFRIVAAGEVPETGDLYWNAKTGALQPRRASDGAGIKDGRCDGSVTFLRVVSEAELRSHVARLNGIRSGKKRTPAKAAASRANGAKGGLRKGKLLLRVAVPRQ